MKRKVCVLVALMGSVLWLAACAPAAAPTSVPGPAAASQPATAPTATTPPFPTKDITFIVPVTPGGGFDTNARLIAPYLQKYLPGKPNVVIKNVPGGEWRVGIMEMYKATPDGHTISIFNIPGNVLGPITGQAEYDLNKIPWIGRITDTVYVAVASPKSGIKTLDDLKKAGTVKSGVVGLTSSSALAVILSAEEMGYKVKLINYDGSQEALLATVRGDIDFSIFPFPSVQKLVVGANDLVPVMVFGKQRLKDLPNTPSVVELGYEKLLTVVALDYMVGVTPGTPSGIVKIWRDAFDKANQDSEFVNLLTNQLKMTPNPMNGDQATQRIKDTLDIYSNYKDLLMQYVPK
jgi:tripartite-type tricarboxylate transporter receptor subunit TctC